MATTFKFEAKDGTGRTVSGTLTAESQAEVVADLRRKSLVPISIQKSYSQRIVSLLNIKSDRQ